MRELRMPRFDLGDSDRMTLLAWQVEEGDEISEGQVVLEVETDKAAMEVEAPFDGILARKLYAEDDEVEPGMTLAWVAELGEEYDPDALPDRERPASESGQQPPSEEAKSASKTPVATDADRSLGSGVAVSAGDLRGFPRGFPRRRPEPADLPEHRVAADLGREAEHAGTHERSPLTRQRRAIARATSRSNDVPQFGVSRELDADPAARALNALRAVEPTATLTDVLLLAIAQVLRALPNVNSWFSGEDVFRFERANIAVAVDGPHGVVAPVIRAVDTLDPGRVVAERARLVEAARDGRLKENELQGATFTLSNIGPLEADALLPMLTPPQVAILAIGRRRNLGGGPTMNATFVGDHRVIDGADGARFLSNLVARLEGMPESGSGGDEGMARAAIEEGR